MKVSGLRPMHGSRCQVTGILPFWSLCNERVTRRAGGKTDGGSRKSELENVNLEYAATEGGVEEAAAVLALVEDTGSNKRPKRGSNEF